MIWETEEDTWSERRKLGEDKGGHNSLSYEYKEEIQVIFHKYTSLDLISSALTKKIVVIG